MAKKAYVKPLASNFHSNHRHCIFRHTCHSKLNIQRGRLCSPTKNWQRINIELTIGGKMHSKLSVISKYTWVATLALATGFIGSIPSARADEAQAKDLFKAMSKYLATQQSISFDYDTNLEVVTKDDQKLSLASSGSVTVNRPGQIRATRKGGFADVEMVFDGTTVTLLDKEKNQYAQTDVPGTIDNLIDVIRTKFQRPLPAADLLRTDIYERTMPMVDDTKDLGTGVIRGEECDHFAFRTKNADFQIWITQGDKPHPVRLTIDSKKVKDSPEYTIDIRNWQTGHALEASTFHFVAPAGAKQVKASELVDFDELPEIFKIKP
jgi:hypothetical protein